MTLFTSELSDYLIAKKNQFATSFRDDELAWFIGSLTLVIKLVFTGFKPLAEHPTWVSTYEPL